jgi:hypothetical protein
MVLKHLYFYTSTQAPLQPTSRHFCTESVEFLLRITQILLHRQLVQTNTYLLLHTHTESFTHRGFLHTCFYADALTQRAFAHRELLHTKPIPHANNLLDAGAFTHKTFCTQTSDASPAQEYPASSSVFRIDTRFVQGIWTMKQKPNHGFALIWTISRCFVWEGLFGACPAQYNRNFT